MALRTKITKCGQLILLVALASLLSVAVPAQEVTKDKSAAEIKPRLELQLSTVTTAVCMDSRLVLELEVTNIGEETVVVKNVGRLGNFFSFSYSSPDGLGRSGGMGRTSSINSVDVPLQPGLSLQSTHEFPLDSDFFQEAGTYKLKTSFGFHDSNEVTFEIYDCGKPQKVKEQK